MKLRNLLLAGLLCLLPFSLFANPIKGLLERIEIPTSSNWTKKETKLWYAETPT